MTSFPTNNILLGDCVSHMASLPSQCADFVLTDPPYLVNYRNRSGQSVANDVDDRWLAPAFKEAYRLLKPDAFCISFYGWTSADRFISA